MSKSFKKLFLLVAVITMIGTILAGCKGSDEASKEEDLSKIEDSAAMADYDVDVTFKANEPLTFSMLFSDQPVYPYKADWTLLKEITDRTNVSLDMTIVPMSDYEQKRSLLISSGDAPLIIPKTYPGQEGPFVSSGAILPVSDYIDWMPNFKDKVEKWELEGYLDGLRQKDGKFYVLPGLHENVWQDYTLMVRKDIFDENNIELPTTWDELHDALVKLKEIYPDKTPYSDRWKFDSTLNFASGSFGTIGGWGLGNGAYFDRENEEFVFAPATDEYKEMLTYFHSLVEEGLLDRESFTQEDDQAESKFVNGESFVMATNFQELVRVRGVMDETLGKGNYEIVKINVPGGPAGHKLNGTKLENGIMFSSKAKDDPNFKAMMQFIDWLYYSDEGQELTKWGVEDEHFTKDDSGKRTLLDPWNYLGLNPTGTKDLRVENGFSGGVFSYGGTTELLHSMMNEEEVKFQDMILSTKTVVDPAPPYPMDQMQSEQLTLVSTPLNDFAKTSTLQFILGDRDLSEWDAYVAELKSKGMDKFLEIVNGAYEEYKENNK
ncbi:ABC transporter substrate-binding protein [Bacillus timonensis]|uniref:ABC transporter substrate-binding protein n=1 Tax=Bacillus timonensis TaxID=1033734 RepID=UPI0002883F3C|nr:extracellular solute-binding protein [Bacillus timonensis]